LIQHHKITEQTTKQIKENNAILLPFLGSTAQLRLWPPPQNPAEFLGDFSTIEQGH
jgi:hypothetical protein